MASIDFPNSPTDGQTFTSGNATYTYIASKGYWDAVTTTVGIQLSSLSVGAEATAAGDGAIAYDNTTGVFTYTPPVVGAPTSFTDITTFGTTTEITSVPVPSGGTTFPSGYKVQASSTPANANFGYSSSISDDGSTAIVGAQQTHAGAVLYVGAAYIFTKSGSTWIEQAALAASDQEGSDSFGTSVSISSDGNTAIVGAFYEGGTGSAYIFTRSGATWSQQAKIVASDAESNDQFGTSVSISGDGNTVIVGAWWEDTGASNAGAAYIFVRSGTSWSQTQKIQASDKEIQDFFGISVSISSDGNTALVGAAYEDTVGAEAGAVYIFTRSGELWSQQAKIQASDAATSDSFGKSVSISSDGNTALVGAYGHDTGGADAGSAYIFTRSGSTWSQQAKIQASDAAASDLFGISVSISSAGNTALVGAYGQDTGGSNAGSAYIFTRSGSTWSQQAKIQASDAEASDSFGKSVSISSDGNTVLVGAQGEDTNATDAGAAYVFTRSGSTWSQTQKVQASDPSAANFGLSVSISSGGTTALVGAPYDSTTAANFGAAYMFSIDLSILLFDVSTNSVFSQSGLSENFTANFTNVPTTNDRTTTVELIVNQGGTGYLPTTVQIDGVTQTIVWQNGFAPTASTNATDIISFSLIRSGSAWTVLGEIEAYTSPVTPPTPLALTSLSVGAEATAAGDGAIAYDNTTGVFTYTPPVVGAPTSFTDITTFGTTTKITSLPTSSTASVYEQQARLIASDAEASDTFSHGISMSSDGRTAMIGAVGEDTNGASAGSVYVYTLSGTTWSQEAKIQPSDIEAGDNFGVSVSLSGDGNTAIIGSYFEDDGATNRGSAYVFIRSGTTWTQQAKFGPSITGTNNLGSGMRYGNQVHLSEDGNSAIVGAYGETSNSVIWSGAAYFYNRNGTSWSQVNRIQASTPSSNGYFGNSCSISGDGSTATVAVAAEGKLYVYSKSGTNWSLQIKLNVSLISSSSLSYDGNTLAAGAHTAAGGGAVYTFTRSGTAWAGGATIVPSDLEAGDNFGIATSVSYDGNTIAVGADGEDTGATDAGAAYIFTKSGSTWSQAQKVQGSVSQVSTGFGSKVRLANNGTQLLVSARQEDPDATDAGAAYTFGLAPNTMAHDVSTASLFVYNSQSANFTANFTNVPTTDDRTISVALIINQGASGYLPTGVQIDGVTQTIVWQNGFTPTASTNATDIISFSLIRSAGSWTVLGEIEAYTSSTALTTFGSTTEIAAALTGATGVVAHDITSSSLFIHSSVAADFTVNFTNVPTTESRTISAALIINQGGTGYLPTAVQIDGVTQTILWQGSTTPTAGTSATDIASFTLIRSGNAWTVIGTVTAFGAV